MSAVHVLQNAQGEYSPQQVEILRKEYPIGAQAVMYGNRGFEVKYEGQVVAVNKYGVQIEWTYPEDGRVFQTASKPGVDRFELVSQRAEGLTSLTELKQSA